MILKKLKLFRKAFLTDFMKFHYSQFGEDIIVSEILRKDITDGYFVDVGCYHPKKFSNTYMLYKKGWRGINIDMEPDKISLFKMVRPSDTNISCPISDKKEKTTIYRFSEFGLGSTINKDFASKTTDAICDEKTIKTKTLNEVIHETPYRETQIDLLSIDAEGMDFRILNSFDLKKYKPKLIIIEDHNNNIKDIMETDTYRLLNKHGYILRSWTFYSLIFILPGSDILKDRENYLKPRSF